MLLALNMEEGYKSQGMQVASINWKSKGNGFSLRASIKGHSSADALIFTQ